MESNLLGTSHLPANFSNLNTLQCQHVWISELLLYSATNWNQLTLSPLNHSKSAQERAARVRMCNSVKFETGWNYWTILKKVTYTAQLHIDISPLLLSTWPGVLQYSSAILTGLWASIGVTCSYSSRPFNALLTTTNATTPSLLNCGFSMYTCCIGQRFLPPWIRHSSVTLPIHTVHVASYKWTILSLLCFYHSHVILSSLVPRLPRNTNVHAWTAWYPFSCDHDVIVSHTWKRNWDWEQGYSTCTGPMYTQ